MLVGYPGSQASCSAGRVGRRGRRVWCSRSRGGAGGPAPVITRALRGPRESADPDNPVSSEHVKCGVRAPSTVTSRRRGARPAGRGGVVEAPHVPEIRITSRRSGFLHRRDDVGYWMADAHPAQDVSLAGGDDNVLIRTGHGASHRGDRQGTSITTVHEGAIYQVQGVTWRVERFDSGTVKPTSRRWSRTTHGRADRHRGARPQARGAVGRDFAPLDAAPPGLDYTCAGRSTSRSWP